MLETLQLWLHVTRRNWMVYRKNLIANISPTVADPALIMISLGLGLSAFVSEINGMSYLQFLAPGLTVSTALFTSFFETSYGFYIRMTYDHIFKAMLTTPIGIREIVIGEFIWVALKGAMMSVGVSIVLAICGLMVNPIFLPFLMVTGMMIGVSCGALGLLATSYVKNINQFQTVYSFLIAPLYFFSGIFFPVEKMALQLRILAECFPVIHGVRIAQALFWNRNIFETVTHSGSILFFQCCILSYFAYVRIRKKLVV